MQTNSEADSKTESNNVWQRTPVANLLRNAESGKYYARVKVSGKQKWKTLKTDVLSVAKLRLADVEREIREQARVAGADTSASMQSLTFHSFAEVWLKQMAGDASLRESTKRRRQTAILAVMKTWKELSAKDVRRVTANECEEWSLRARSQGTGFRPPGAKSAPKRGMSASAFNKSLDALRAVFDLARNRGVIYANPAANVGKAKIERKRLVLPSSAQFRALISQIKKAGGDKRRKMSGAVAIQAQDCADLVRFLAFSGVRISEANAVRWSHVDDTRGTLHVPGTKTATSFRTIPLFPALKALLAEIKTRRGVEAEELGVEKEQPASAILRVKDATGALQSASSQLGIKRLTHHDMRHLFATRCIESGVDIPTVSRWLGHSDGGTLAMSTYGHLRQEHSFAQAAKVTF